MSSPEKRYYQNRVQPWLKELKCRYNRIETGAIGIGYPDVCITIRGLSCKAELKVCDSRGKIDTTPQQLNWHRKERKHGGRSFYLIFDPVRKQSWACTIGNIETKTGTRSGLYLDDISEKKLIETSDDLYDFMVL
jgi:hypothetical protein